ncbi:MAG TPA: hypothetical protein VID04_05675, partial [Methylomirabilota bacterium]
MESTAYYVIGGGYLFALYLTIFWLLVLFRERAGAREQIADQRDASDLSAPLVTVAIPAWNEADNIQETMQSAL